VASKSISVVIDDLTGRELAPDQHEKITFSLDGVGYELDVSKGGAERLRSALAPYVRAGRRLVGKRRRPERRTRVGADAATIRAWAASNGVEVSRRGRISESVRAQFDAANG
jgi:hypothetical protein